MYIKLFSSTFKNSGGPHYTNEGSIKARLEITVKTSVEE